MTDIFCRSFMVAGFVDTRCFSRENSASGGTDRVSTALRTRVRIIPVERVECLVHRKGPMKGMFSGKEKGADASLSGETGQGLTGHQNDEARRTGTAGIRNGRRAQYT